MTKARELFKQLQDEVYEAVKNKPYITKKEIEQKLDLGDFRYNSSSSGWSDEFYAIINPLLIQGRIRKVSRGTFKAVV